MDFVGIDKFSLLDYDENVSIVLFAPKCNFRCPFCHNGDSVLNSDTPIKFENILSYLKTRQRLVDAVVITGGEPTLMPDLVEKISEIRMLGFKIKLDTNGTNPDLLSYLIDNNYLDYVAMDIKNSEQEYPKTAGCQVVDMNKIKESIEILKNSNIPYEFRTTLVKEFHSIESIKGIGELIRGAEKLFLQKFVDREGVIQKGLHDISIEEANKYKEILTDYVYNVELRGY